MCERKISLCKKYVYAMFCEPRAKRIRGMRYCMSKHITVSHTSVLKMENVFEKSDQISYSCKAEIHIHQFSKWKMFSRNLIKSHTPVKLEILSNCKENTKTKGFYWNHQR